MKFKLRRTGSFADDEDKAKYEELGFKFNPYCGLLGDSYPWMTSWDDNDELQIEINTLEELLKFIDKWGTIVLGHDYDDEKRYRLEIYDDYRE